MRIEPTAHGRPGAGDRATSGERTEPAQLIAELERAGLLSVEMDDDGEVSFGLTVQGRRSARLMAMSRQGHALVLLGALVGTENGPN